MSNKMKDIEDWGGEKQKTISCPLQQKNVDTRWMVSNVGEQKRSNCSHWWILNMRYKESAVFSDVSAVIHCWSLVSVTKYRANVSVGWRFSSVAGVNLYPHMNHAALHALSRARRCRSNKLSATRMVPALSGLHGFWGSTVSVSLCSTWRLHWQAAIEPSMHVWRGEISFRARL